MSTISTKRKIISRVILAVILLTACGCAQAQDRSPIVSDTLQPYNIPNAAIGSVMLVSASNPLPDGFAVGALVNLYNEKRSFALASSGIRLTRETFEAANQMFAQAKRDGVSGFILTSGYRTEDEQRTLYENTTDGTAAPPGASEHQTGLAFDVTSHSDGGFEDTPQFRWLSEHCWDYGFILRYPEGKDGITGIPYEPWHYRYVGAIIAREIHQNSWTLEEYLEDHYERNGS